MFKTIDELNNEIEGLNKKLGITKVNLVHESGEHEGIWAIPLDEESKAKLDSDTSNGEFAFVRLMNQPLGWNDLSWGGLVRVRTNGDKRAYAEVSDQNLKALTEDRKNLAELFKDAN